MEIAMNCKYNKQIGILWLVIGVGTIVLGAVIGQMIPEDSSYTGGCSMLSGFGTGILVVALARYFRDHFSSPEKRKEREIEKKDERNVLITRTAYTIAGILAYALFAVMSIVFTFLGEYKACWITIGALYLDLIVFTIAYHVLQKKM